MLTLILFYAVNSSGDKMSDGTVGSTVLSLQKANTCLERALVVMQKEITGFCAGTGKIKELNEIGKAIHRDFDFKTVKERLEMNYARLKRDEAISKEFLDSCVAPSQDVIRTIENKIQNIKQVQAEVQQVVNGVREHNKTAKKFKVNAKTTSKILGAGRFTRWFNSEHKKASTILKLIEEKYDTNFSGFLNMVDNASNRLREFETDLQNKKKLIEDHDIAVEEYRQIKLEANNFSIHREYSDTLIKAFNNPTFIYGFAIMSGHQGKSVVDAVFKYRLMRTILNECSVMLNELESSPYDLSQEYNAGVALKKVEKLVNTYNKVMGSSVRFDFNKESSFNEMYKTYLRHLSNDIGIQMTSYKDKTPDLERQPSLKLEILTKKDRAPVINPPAPVEEEKGGIFSGLVSKKAKKVSKRQLLAG